MKWGGQKETTGMARCLGLVTADAVSIRGGEAEGSPVKAELWRSRLEGDEAVEIQHCPGVCVCSEDEIISMFLFLFLKNISLLHQLLGGEGDDRE